ncbi:condensation domain-containing protein [Streptomyces lydicus]
MPVGAGCVWASTWRTPPGRCSWCAAASRPLRVVDLRSAAAQERRSRVAADVEEERCTPFEAEQAPLVRFVLHLLGEDEFQLTLAVHHAVLDDWSVTVLLAELMDC